ncbi:MAG: glycosyltransferase [Lachnospiraceae bacterium]|nr:glycosyltransferase [Lachnospiraceae bacterium]
MNLLEGLVQNLNDQNRKRFVSYLKRNGFKASYYKVIEKLKWERAEGNGSDYDKQKPDEDELARQRCTEFPYKYKISIVVPAYETNTAFLKQMLSSVLKQTYTEWELCIADGSKSDNVQNVVMDTIGRNNDQLIGSKIKYQRLRENKGISGNTNAALSMANGDYIGFLDHDDVLTPDALYETVKALNDTVYKSGNITLNRTHLLYSDEDKINEDVSRYFDTHIKPGFDIDLIRSNNYICHFLVVSSEVIKKTGGFLKEYDGAQDHDLIFRCIEQLDPSNIRHIPKILYHWRAHEVSTALSPDNKLYAYEAGKRAIEDHLKRCGLKARVLYTEHLGFFRVRYDPSDLRYISMTPGELALYNADMLESLPADAIMLIDSKVKPIGSDCIEELLGNMVREEVGAVGGKLLSKDGRVDNAGFMYDDSGKLKPRFKGMNSHFSGYMHRASIQNRVDRLDKNCIMLKKSALMEWLSDGNSLDLKKDFNKNRLPEKYIYVYDPFAKFRRI